MGTVTQNYNKILSKIRDYENFYTRKSGDVNLVAVSKTFSEENIAPLLKLGHRIFGENRVQEASSKWINLKKLYQNVELHLIGPLQSNKVNQALEIFDCIQTIDREKIALKIKSSIEQNQMFRKKNFKFMIQVNTGMELQKSGISTFEAKKFCEWCKNDLRLNIVGLMSIPPIDEPPEKHFSNLNNIASECKLYEKSMGMSNDFKTAIEKGATFVRIGSAIFGKRT